MRGRASGLTSVSAALRTAAVVLMVVYALAVALFCGYFFAFLFELSGGLLLPIVTVVAVGLFFWHFRPRITAQIEHASRAFEWASAIWFPALLAGMALGAYAGITIELVRNGDATAKPPIGHETGALAWAAYEHYLWELADDVPVLRLPKYLNWTPAHQIGGVNGLVTLTAKLVLFLPIFGLISAAYRRRRDKSAASDTPPAHGDPGEETGRPPGTPGPPAQAATGGSPGTTARGSEPGPPS